MKKVKQIIKQNGFAKGNLSFDIKVQPYDGDDSWVEGKILEAKKILDGKIPGSSEDCGYCTYVRNSA